MKSNRKLIGLERIELREAHRKVLFWFFSFPDRQMGLNDLSVELGLAKTTVKRVVLQLVDENFLNKEEIGKAWRISCNHEHNYNKTVKITYNLELVFLSGIVQEIYKIFPNARSIILFGSYRKGDDNEKSDIDIAVETLNNDELKIVKFGIIEKFGYRKNVPVNVHVFSRNKVDLNLFANISNGIILDGFLEVHP